ncbi:pheromone A receptor-domain-containing protein [Pholiota molesta]|nr:pheromone A receptor-domain-containing protein [Pholiota molesta]
MSSDPTYPLFPVLSFLGFVLVLVPLPWHLQAWNSGTCAFMIWTSLACLIEFINGQIWAGNLNDNLPVWCDISSKFLLGAGVGITASTLCISRRLYGITSVQTVSITIADKRRAVIIDLCIAVGIPVLVMALHYIVQPHRYNIVEDIGCYAAIYNTLPAYFLVYMWPILLGVISFVYSALTFRAFWKRRLQLVQLMSSNSSLTMSRYIRLMMLAVTDMALTIPLGVFSVWFGTHGVNLAPWISWEDTHFNFSNVQLVPALIWRSNPRFSTSVELTRWIFVASAFVFFALFGFAGEALKHYRMLFWTCAKPFGFKPKTATKGAGASLHSWKKHIDAKSPAASPPPIYVKTNVTPVSAKGSRFSFTSSSDATVRADFDVEKSPGLYSPSKPSASDYTYPPSPPFSDTDLSPTPSVSRHDSHWPRNSS